MLARAEPPCDDIQTATENPVVVAGPLSVDLVGRSVSLNQNQIN